MADTAIGIISCVPVDPKACDGLPPEVSANPDPGSEITKCEHCTLSVYIGPQQRQLKQDKPEMMVLCPNCLSIEIYSAYSAPFNEVKIDMVQLSDGSVTPFDPFAP